MMCNAYVWPRSVEGQGQSLRLNIVWLYFESLSFESLVGFTYNFPKMLAMMQQCAVPMFDQGQFKVKVKN